MDNREPKLMDMRREQARPVGLRRDHLAPAESLSANIDEVGLMAAAIGRLPVGRPVKLADINAKLEAEGLGLVLVVSHWDGQGEREPTTLELMTPAEYERRCCATPMPVLGPGVVLLPDERGWSS